MYLCLEVHYCSLQRVKLTVITVNTVIREIEQLVQTSRLASLDTKATANFLHLHRPRKLPLHVTLTGELMGVKAASERPQAGVPQPAREPPQVTVEFEREPVTGLTENRPTHS